MGIPMLKIRRPVGRLIFNMGIVIPGKTVFLIETAPCFWHQGPPMMMSNDMITIVLLSYRHKLNWVSSANIWFFYSKEGSGKYRSQWQIFEYITSDMNVTLFCKMISELPLECLLEMSARINLCILRIKKTRLYQSDTFSLNCYTNALIKETSKNKHFTCNYNSANRV